MTAAAVVAAALSISGCTSPASAQKPPALPPPPVSVLAVAAENTPIYNEFAAQTYARDLVEVRGRVDGYIEKRLFQVGSEVQPGQILYELDLRPYQAEESKAKADLAQAEANLEFARRQVALIQAQADLAQAEANLVKARQDVARLVPLVKEDAAAQQDLDNANAALNANEANVNAKKANVEQNRLSTQAQIATSAAQVEGTKAQLRTAELNLEYATIKAPVGGRVGDSLIQVGGLVTKTSAQPLTTIVPLDPIWVRFKVSESAYLAFSKRQSADKDQVRNAPLQLVLADNTVYEFPGKFQNAVNQVDAKTGTLELQATFANPSHNVLPGQFGRIRMRLDEKKNVILVPQRAVQELQGLQSVFTVGEGNKVIARAIVVGDRIGDRWIIEQGLKPGDQVIVEGLQKARPGLDSRAEAVQAIADSGHTELRKVNYMARFFIDRPVFAIVIAIVIVIVGAVAIPTLPIATYPEVVPPVVQIIANYRGGNSQDLEKTVAQPIEQQLVGLDGMLYFFSRGSNDGTLTIDVTYQLGTDIDLATVKTQNKVNLALPLLPPEVQREGVTVKKVSSAFLMAIAVYGKDQRYDSLFINNYAVINLVDKIGSLEGIGDARLGSPQNYGMRIWINPDKMAKLQLTATDVNNSVQAQNRQNPAGSLGQPPAPRGTDFQYPVNASGRLTEPQQFGDIVLRAEPDGSLLHVRDIGRVELGAQDYKSFSQLSGKPSSLIIAYLTPGANAVETGNRVRAFLEDAKKSFPEGVDYTISYDATKFVTAAVSDVVQTLFEAILLVLIVVFVFLQNWRATLIPLLTVPVAVVGTFALFPLLHFSINMTSMFGLVLAIGIVVDDAIVVVEAVQLNIDRGMAPKEATIHAMNEVSGPVVAIAFILGAVFIPVSFLGGISGLIYRQFALTIAASVMISAFSALSLSPALAAMILKPKSESKGLLDKLFAGFNIAFDWTTNRYLSGVRTLVRRSVFALAGLLAFYFFAGTLFKTLPGGFLPDEDQGVFFAAIRLPDGASLERTRKVAAEVEQLILTMPAVENVTTLGGTDFTTSTNNSNVTTLIATLKPWEDRKAAKDQFGALLRQAQGKFYGVDEAIVFGFGLPPILGLGTGSGFEFMLEDRAGVEVSQLADAANLLLDAARKRPELTNVVSTFRNTVPSYQIDLDTDKAQTLGIPPTDVYNALQTFLGGLYVNDFNRFGRTWKVLMQAEPEFRDHPDDVSRFYVRSAAGEMVPLSTLVRSTPVSVADVIYRYNRFRAVKILGSAAPGYSSGQAAAAMQEVAAEVLPQGFGYEWTGTVFQQRLSEGKEGFIFGFAAILVFLFLAALYESWAIPFAVVLAVPLGLFGALLAVFVRSYAYDVYTQIGIVTLIGLSAKNAILIVEFAKLRREEGLGLVEAAMEAAHLRLRPILMTSFAFILGVIPLVLATGAGAASRRALGTAVFGGMLAATLLAVFIVPVLYVVIERFADRRREPAPAIPPHPEGSVA